MALTLTSLTFSVKLGEALLRPWRAFASALTLNLTLNLGQVVHALVAFEVASSGGGDRTFQLDASGAAFAVKCLEKARLPTNEDPFKEVVVLKAIRQAARTLHAQQRRVSPLDPFSRAACNPLILGLVPRVGVRRAQGGGGPSSCAARGPLAPQPRC